MRILKQITDKSHRLTVTKGWFFKTIWFERLDENQRPTYCAELKDKSFYWEIVPIDLIIYLLKHEEILVEYSTYTKQLKKYKSIKDNQTRISYYEINGYNYHQEPVKRLLWEYNLDGNQFKEQGTLTNVGLVCIFHQTLKKIVLNWLTH